MKHNLLLTIDTAHPTARVVVANDIQILGMREWPNTPQVGTDLLVYTEELLKECGQEKRNISRIGVHAGPGNYGLVRVGIITATILAQAVGAELVGLSADGAEEAVQEARKGAPVSAIEPKYS
jgi:tRNA A37 threonylcarbamoyladenosine modification protein TsaB